MNAAFHEHFMQLALREADKAAAAGEVPTGCLIIADPGPGATPACLAAVKVLGRAHNQTETLKDPTAHAEMIAITQAAAAIGDFRLTQSILYVTKEPCVMCAGAIVLARIPTVVYGASDPRRGGHSCFNIPNHPALIHRVEIIEGVLADACRERLQSFFRERRRKVAKTAPLPQES
jgi:tRNA(adenine34) deaminase